ncbi:Rrn6p KNAG_0C02970 [Huiozyma naganishii CBS 8797]|uniref:RNA polymerase I-specific transcription initiation factor RRN6 n=1 Tax=Huiozyma naganishii (strain ATCC MYA-139 / BCRC 22969 / CBS 8797 / KCTC 17520 / NBRC 10181 / NCYC 3082 / Yp74L-3) TaxID=1071383 RepID=J7RIQ9_HUIN7|nr:hypothetical protein KNAG_0C02970 [Kazachstania naganishii CBS 8797]CCK69408.1 hypothetical protein KNAG_0C02970 [Kazachstania naganishii CBS 8797]
MNHPNIPTRRPVGIQLATGVEGPGIYVGSENKSIDKGGSWLQAVGNQTASNSFLLRISPNPLQTIDVRKQHLEMGDALQAEMNFADMVFSDTDDNTGDELERSEFSADDDELFNKTINTSLRWGSVSPTISATKLKVYKKVDRKELKGSIYHARRPMPKKSVHFDYLPRKTIKEQREKIDVLERRRSSRKHSILTLDPSIGSTMTMGIVQTAADVRNDVKSQILAYLGPQKHQLMLSLVSASSPENNLKCYSRVGASISFSSKIISINFPKLAYSFSRASDVIGIITKTSLHILKVKGIDRKTGEIDCVLFKPLHFSQLGDFPLADIAFNPWDMNQFALIDIQGNWSIGQIPKSATKYGDVLSLSLESRGSVFQPDHTSLMKRIEWSNSFSRLLIVDPYGMTEIDFSENWQVDLVEAITWSEIRGFKNIDESYSVLLTSREIIFLSTFMHRETKRELSWKHDLDTTDKSLTISVQKINCLNGTVVLSTIHSKKHNTIYLHPFSINNEVIQSLGQGILLKIPGENLGIDQISDSEHEVDDYLEEFCKKIALNIFVKMSECENIYNLALEKPSGEINDFLKASISKIGTNQKEDLKTRWLATTKDIDFVTEDFIHINDTYFRAPSNYDAEGDTELLQMYGYRLSEATNLYLTTQSGDKLANAKTFETLLREVAPLEGHFEDMEELNSLLDQFFKYYENQDISFRQPKTLFSILLQEHVDNVDVFYSKLLQCWAAMNTDITNITREIVKQLLWSYLGVFKKRLYTDEISQIKNNISGQYKDILDDWDTPLENVEENNQEDFTSSTLPLGSQSQIQLKSSQSQIPIIKSSQKTKKSRPKIKHPLDLSSSQRKADSTGAGFPSSQLSSSLPYNMTPAFSLMQPPMLSSPVPSTLMSSQTNTTTRNKRKRKKVGGFT